MSTIGHIKAREIIDSRGNPTVEVEVATENYHFGRASAPAGASTGSFEACDLRDGDPKRYLGKGVLKAVKNVEEEIAPRLLGADVCSQGHIDRALNEIDGTENKSRLGANAILATSLACAKAAANFCGLPLYRYLGGTGASRLPVPLVNVINGGAHADNGLDFQEFMLVPLGASTFGEALRWSAEIFSALKNILRAKKYSTNLGDEGGVAPDLATNEDALKFLLDAIAKAGLSAGKDVALAIDAAASEFCSDGVYSLAKGKRKLSSDEMIDWYTELCSSYPIVSIEDGLAEQDWRGFAKLTEKLGNKVQIVGDDLFATNPARLIDGIEKSTANSILIKLNQIGTLSETLKTIELAKRAGYTPIVSHRSGETEDTTIADLAVASNVGQIKTGSVNRTDRTAKYNQLLRIEEELDSIASFYWSRF